MAYRLLEKLHLNDRKSGTRLELPPPPPLPEGVSPLVGLQPPGDVAPLFKGDEGSVTLSADNVWHKPWRGFGASLSWTAHWVGRLPSDQLDEICDLLFDLDKGLGFNVVRFNIAGGANFDITLKPKPDSERQRFVPGYKPTAEGPYDWGADPYQRNVLLAAKKKGVDIFSAISYAPPWWMTKSGCVAGSENGRDCNLRPECFEAFADYLTEVVRHYREVHKIPFESLEPINEAADGGWRKGGRQEGCSFSIPEQESILNLVHDKLAQKCPGVLLAANDSWALNTARDFPKMSPQTLGKIGQINVHGYITQYKQYPPQHLHVAKEYAMVRDLANRLGGVEVWQTEWCPVLNAAHDDIDLGLVMARYIVQSINFMDAVVWCYLQCTECTTRFSLFTIRWHPRDSRPHIKLKKFWVMKQLSTFIRPGALRILPKTKGECEHCVAAFYDPQRARVSVLIVNQEAKDQELQLHLNGFQACEKSFVEAYRTSPVEDFVPLPLGGAFSMESSLTVAGRSLITLVFNHVTL